jgi:flagellum-specific peptidoglycan hydrolase FlgJ
MASLKTKADYEKMTNDELVAYLDKLDKVTFNSYVDADTKVRYFVDKYGVAFINAVKGTGLFLSGIVAQSIFESGYGRNLPTDKRSGAISNNFAGIKYNPNIHEGYVVSDTTEVVKGKKVRVPNVKFAKFTDPTQGIKKHFAVLMGDRYKNARLNAKSPEEQIKMLVEAGYSTMSPTAYVNLMKGNISRVRKLLPFGRIA